MTRKDFELIARVVAKCPDMMRSAIAREFASELRHTNPNFDAERFLKACGVDA